MSVRPRIAIVTHAYPSAAEPQRGIAVYQRALALSSLATVEVFCVAPRYPRARILQPRTFGYRDSAAASPFTSLPVTFVRYPAFPYLTRPLNGFSCYLSLISALRAAQPDVVYACFAYPDGFAATMAGNKLAIPVIVEPMGSDLRCVTTSWQRHFVKQTMRQSSFVTPVSQDLARYAVGYGAAPDRVQTIRCGCNPDMFHLGDRIAARTELNVPRDSELIVFVGRLVEIKGLRELFETLPDLMRERPQLELACIGDGPLSGELRERARSCGIASRVNFLGSLESGGIAKWLTASNVLCLPSYSEGIPNVILESLSCGRAVVASDVGGIPEIVKPSCGILTPPRDASALRRALSQALDRTWDEEQIALSFKRSWEDAARETLEVCLRVLDEANPSASGADRRVHA